MKKEFKYSASMFCTDLLYELKECLDPAEAWEVEMAVLDKVHQGIEPCLSKKYMHGYYERLLEFTQYAYNEYHKKDRRSETSAENGKKGGRPKKEAAQEPVNEGNIINCNGKEIQKRRKINSILQRLNENPGRYEGMAFEDLCYEFDDIEPYPDRLKELFVESGFFDKSETA